MTFSTYDALNNGSVFANLNTEIFIPTSTPLTLGHAKNKRENLYM